jgi:PPOX class probable F420-dependent enzyme
VADDRLPLQSPFVTVPGAVERLLQADAVAVLITVNHDSSPQASVVWFEAHGDEVVIFAERATRKVGNLRRDPRALLVILQPGVPAMRGVPDYALLHGQAMVEDGDDVALRDRLAGRYMGLDRYPFAPPNSEWTIIRFRVHRIGGHGPGLREKAAYGGWDLP